MTLLSQDPLTKRTAEVSPEPLSKKGAARSLSAGGIFLGMLAFLLWEPVLVRLWGVWSSNDSLSHGPIIFVLAFGLLWMRRDEMNQWASASPAALGLLLPSALLHAAAYFADVVFLKSLSLIGITLGTVWFLGGKRALNAVIGPIGLLIFTIPWPTTLVERLAFPMQLTSTAYAALVGGMVGLPIHREGVQLSVMSASGDKPIYSILVAQQCSGLKSLAVLLALSYLLAYHTPVRLGWRALMVVIIVPMTLLSNTVRLIFIMLAGAHYSAAAARWIHDHEAPVLIFFCSLGLMGLRQALLVWGGRPRSAMSPLAQGVDEENRKDKIGTENSGETLRQSSIRKSEAASHSDLFIGKEGLDDTVSISAP